MNLPCILLVGAGGFIGGHLYAALRTAGYRVVGAGRRRPAHYDGEWFTLDLTHTDVCPPVLPATLRPDCIINTVGLLTPRIDTLRRVQTNGAIALTRLAQHTGSSLIQISALGAGEQPHIPFLATKAAADDFIIHRQLDAVVLRPSLVIGPGATSTRWLCRLSRLPGIPLLNTCSRIQPLHINDLTQAILALLRQWPEHTPCVLPLAGRETFTQPQLLNLLREAQGLPPAHYRTLPTACARGLCHIGNLLHLTAINHQTHALSQTDNTASPRTLTRLLGAAPAPLRQTLPHTLSRGDSATLLLRPVLLASLALLWLWTAFVCLGPAFTQGRHILAQADIHGDFAGLLIISGALCDALLGLGLLHPRTRRHALTGQLIITGIYTLIITCLLPHYWLDPFQSIGKNLPLMAATLWLLLNEHAPFVRHQGD